MNPAPPVMRIAPGTDAETLAVPGGAVGAVRPVHRAWTAAVERHDEELRVGLARLSEASRDEDRVARRRPRLREHQAAAQQKLPDGAFRVDEDERVDLVLAPVRIE